MLEEALAYSGDYVDEHPEFVPSGMPRDCAVAIALYTYGALIPFLVDLALFFNCKLDI